MFTLNVLRKYRTTYRYQIIGNSIIIEFLECLIDSTIAVSKLLKIIEIYARILQIAVTTDGGVICMKFVCIYNK